MKIYSVKEQIFQLRQELEYVRLYYWAELEVNAQDSADEYLIQINDLQTKINELLN